VSAALLDTCFRGLEPFNRMLGNANGSRLIESDGAITCVVPAIPQAALFNSTVVDRDRPELLDAALTRAEAEYADSGISAWGAWIVDGDDAAEEIAIEHALTIDSTPLAMAAQLEAIDLSADTSVVSERWDMPAAAQLNELGYRVPAGLFTAIGEVDQPEGARCFIAEPDGNVAACAVSFANGEDDCGIYWVATHPAYQRRGLARAAMTAALNAAVADGFATTTLQATRAGAPLYASLGYEDLGRTINLWQRRTTSV
jgi:ribosomal protein S18 acetylase RimI-like enzyme